MPSAKRQTVETNGFVRIRKFPRRGHVPALQYKSVRDARYSPEGRIPYSLFPIHYSLFPIPPFPLSLFLFSQKTGGKTAGICLLSLGKSVDETEKICYNMYQRATARRAAKKQSFGSDNREVFQ